MANFVFKKTTPINQIKPIIEYLKEQDSILDNLNKLLDSEYAFLRDKQFHQLTEITKLKSEMMVKLQSNDQRLKLHPEVAKLKNEYASIVNSLKLKMKNCQYKNSVNGNLIRMCMQTTNKFKAMLVGMRDSSTRNMTYNAKGSASARGITRLSVVA